MKGLLNHTGFFFGSPGGGVCFWSRGGVCFWSGGGSDFGPGEGIAEATLFE